MGRVVRVDDQALFIANILVQLVLWLFLRLLIAIEVRHRLLGHVGALLGSRLLPAQGVPRVQEHLLRQKRLSRRRIVCEGRVIALVGSSAILPFPAALERAS